MSDKVRVDQIEPPPNTPLIGYDSYYGRVIACEWDGVDRFRNGDRPCWQGYRGRPESHSREGVPRLRITGPGYDTCVVTHWKLAKP